MIIRPAITCGRCKGSRWETINNQPKNCRLCNGQGFYRSKQFRVCTLCDTRMSRATAAGHACNAKDVPPRLVCDVCGVKAGTYAELRRHRAVTNHYTDSVIEA